MAKGVTVDLIVDPQGAIKGLDTASGHSSKFGDALGKMAKVGAAALVAVGTAAVGAAAGLAAATRSAANYADEILTAATNTNLSTDELQAYRYAAEQIDVSFETFTKSQGKFTKSMQDAVRSGASPAANAFSQLGLSVTNADGSLRDSTELYWEAIDALGEVSNETERTALAQEIFGKSGAEMNSLIAKGSEGFRELTEEARKNGAIMSGEQLEALGAFDDKMQAMTATVGAAKNALGLTLLPILDDLAGEGSNALGQFSSALLEANGDFSKIGPAFETLGSNLSAALSTAVPKILEVATSLVSGLIEGIVSQGPKLIQTAIPLIVNFATGILKMLPAVLDAAYEIVIAVVEGIADALPTLIPTAVDVVMQLVTTIVKNAPLLLGAALKLVQGLATGVIAAIPVFVKALPGIITGMVDYIVSAIPMVINAGVDLLLSLVEALPEIIDGVVAAIPQIITGVVSAVIGAIPQIIQAGVRLLVALVENTPRIIFEIIKAIPQIVTGIVGAFTDPKMIAQLAKAGGELLKGLWNGIKDLGAWLWRQISGFFNSTIINPIKSLFGIKSPSTLFAGYGEYMVEGLEKGLTSPNSLKPIMADLSKQVTSGFAGSLAATARATVSTGVTGGVGSGNVYITVQGGLDSGQTIGRRIAEYLRDYRASGGRVAFS